MDVVDREQRDRLQAIENELKDVNWNLARVWHAIETSIRHLSSRRLRLHQ